LTSSADSSPTAEAAPVLVVEDLTIEFPTRRSGAGTVRAVDGLGFTLSPGRSLGLVGESGSGKSATALALLGLHRGTSARVGGRVLVDGTDLHAASAAEVRALRGARIAMVFQDPLSSLDPYHTVGDQIAEVYRAHTGAGRRAARTRAVEVLDRVGIADAAHRVNAHPHEFSGGMRQRALIAMALACEPRILVADEPTTALDVTVQAQVLDLLDELRAETGLALVLVTHDFGVVAASADEVLVMQRGRVVEHGPVARVLGAPEAPYTRELIAAVPRIDTPRTVAAPARRSGERSDAPSDESPDAEPLLRVEDLYKHFPAPGGFSLHRQEPVRAVDGVSLDVHRGEALGIVGESGSGKTTLARMMVRLLRPTSGRVLLDGEDFAALAGGRLRERRRDAQMVFQDPIASLNPRRTVGESVADPLRAHGAHDDRAVRREVQQLLERVGLEAAHYDRFPHEFSGGQRQRVGIARALVLRPRLVVCDEPVSALDVTTQAQVIRLLAELRAEFGLALVFVAHDLAVVRQVSDRVAVMRRGRVVELADTDTLYDAPQHPYTRSLLAAVPVPDPDLARERRRERREAAMIG
jgi:peptide/nickel transport system ATP-binding protein